MEPAEVAVLVRGGATDLSLCAMEVMRGGAGSRGQGVDGFVAEAFFHEVWQG